MKNFLVGLSIALSILLVVWCNLNTYFIQENTKKIETLESVAHKHTTDTIFVVHVVYQQEQKTVKKKK